MKVFLSGYGKMGRMLEELALERGWGGRSAMPTSPAPRPMKRPPARTSASIFRCRRAQAPAWLPAPHEDRPCRGTTGLTEPDLDALHELGRELPVIWTANYSTGIAVFRRMLHDYAGVLAGWDKEIVEIHHNQKADAPSGIGQSSCCRSWIPRARRRSFTAARASAASAGRRRSACFPCAAARSRASIPSISSARMRRCRSRTELRAAEFLRRALRAAQAICGRGPGLLYARRAAV